MEVLWIICTTKHFRYGSGTEETAFEFVQLHIKYHIDFVYSMHAPGTTNGGVLKILKMPASVSLALNRLLNSSSIDLLTLLTAFISRKNVSLNSSPFTLYCFFPSLLLFLYCMSLYHHHLHFHNPSPTSSVIFIISLWTFSYPRQFYEMTIDDRDKVTKEENSQCDKERHL